MNINKAYRYQLGDLKKALIIYYIAVAGVYFLTFLLAVIFSDSQITTGSMTSEPSFSAVIFMFVIGLNSFKENFGMLSTNGISRKTMIVSRILVILTVCAFMMAADRVIAVAATALVRAAGIELSIMSIVEQTYYTAATPGWFALQLRSLVFDFTLGLAVMCGGYMTTIMFYRLGKFGRVMVGAGVPTLFFVVLPIIDSTLAKGRISSALLWFFVRALGLRTGEPLIAAASFMGLTVIFLFCAWRMARRAPIYN